MIKKQFHIDLLSSPDSEGLVLEACYDDDPPFLMISVDQNNLQTVTILETKKDITLTLEQLEKIVEIAKREVVNTYWD